MALEAVFFDGGQTGRLEDVQRFRKTLFVDVYKWRLRVEEGREEDQFDRPDTIYVSVLDDGALCGTFRAIRTDRTYLAAEVFPHLAITTEYPRREDVWEISRFGVLPRHHASDLARVNYALMFHFAQRMNATALVAIADLTYERFLRSLGLRSRRYGPPQVIGTDAADQPLYAVSGEIPLQAQSHHRLSALLSHLEHVEISDASQIFGPARVSA